ncbi:hypothetical protein ID866_9552 [Astraeus odoratus]|nr:hypothetical protein ID866_9552 [Astraeus odoratus]
MTSHLFFGLSFSKVAFQSGLVKSTMYQVHRIIQPERSRLHGDHSSTLASASKWGDSRFPILFCDSCPKMTINHSKSQHHPTICSHMALVNLLQTQLYL